MNCRLEFAKDAIVVDRTNYDVEVQPFKNPLDERFARGLLKGLYTCAEAKVRARFIANAFGSSVSIIHDDPWNAYPHEVEIVQPELARQLLN